MSQPQASALELSDSERKKPDSRPPRKQRRRQKEREEREKREPREDITLRLPTELISHIFCFDPLASTDTWFIEDVSQHERLDAPPYPYCLSVAGVCKRWRAIAMICPRLWSRLLLFNPKATNEMIARSKQSPLTIKTGSLWAFEHYNKHSLTLALHEMQRACHIEFSAKGEYFQKSIAVITEKPAPILEKLSISFTDNNAFRLPNNLFQGNVPQLSSIQLRGCILSASSPLIHAGLTTLIMRGVVLRHRPDLSKYYAILEKTPQLEHLVLWHAISYKDETAEADRGIPLKSLKSIKLVDNYMGCCLLMTNIDIPPDAKISLITEVKLQPGEEYYSGDVLPVIVERHVTEETPSDHLTQLVIDELVPKSLKITLGSIPKKNIYGTYMGFDAGTIQYDLSVEWTTAKTFPRDIAAQLMTALCWRLPLRNVQRLCIKGRYSVSPLRWFDTFRHLKDVTTVIAAGDVIYGFINALPVLKDVTQNTESDEESESEAVEETAEEGNKKKVEDTVEDTVEKTGEDTGKKTEEDTVKKTGEETGEDAVKKTVEETIEDESKDSSNTEKVTEPDAHHDTETIKDKGKGKEVERETDVAPPPKMKLFPKLSDLSLDYAQLDKATGRPYIETLKSALEIRTDISQSPFALAFRACAVSKRSLHLLNDIELVEVENTVADLFSPEGMFGEEKWALGPSEEPESYDDVDGDLLRPEEEEEARKGEDKEGSEGAQQES